MDIPGGTPEGIAYMLMDRVMQNESAISDENAARKHILDLYAECLHTVRLPAHRLPKRSIT